MKENRQKRLSFKEEKEKMQHIADDYKKSLVVSSENYISFVRELRVNEDSKNYGMAHNCISDEKINYYTKLKFVVESVLDLLSKESERILRAEFFEKMENSNWWQKFYSRTTFYRNKRKAMNEFFNFFYS